jgi:hypothetical protein
MDDHTPKPKAQTCKTRATARRATNVSSTVRHFSAMLPSLALRHYRSLFLPGNDCNLPGSVHLRSKWTPIRIVHFASMALNLSGCPDGHNRTLTYCLREKKKGRKNPEELRFGNAHPLQRMQRMGHPDVC